MRLEPVALRSRVKHSTIKSLRSLTNFASWVNLQWGFISLYTGPQSKIAQFLTCADPERFVIGGPNLTSCFINILVDEGTDDPNTTISGSLGLSARQRNWRADDSSTVNAGFVAL